LTAIQLLFNFNKSLPVAATGSIEFAVMKSLELKTGVDEIFSGGLENIIIYFIWRY
jgi:hypothetical protein